MLEPPTARAVDLMLGFAERTGLGSGGVSRRYLWTDAFAVCNLLGLAQATGDGRHLELALRLVDRVHHTLGQHRTGDTRHGWLSGLGAAEGEAHPTCGGLRIGKPLAERGPGELLDERLEWDRDGQYFHYLTKWMHALDQAARATGRALFHTWACELVEAAHRAFTYVPKGATRPRMHWKMSTDLSRPLVASMGQHDPLDGLVTCLQLDAGPSGPRLAKPAADFAAMIDPHGLATADPLGLGGLLVDAYRLRQLGSHADAAGAGALGDLLLAAALAGLQHHVRETDPRLPAGHRLAFREFGLAIGLAAAERMLQEDGRARSTAVRTTGADAILRAIVRYAPLRLEIESFWMQADHRRTDPWLEHADINEVMLATTLAPEGFLVLRPWPAAGAG